MNRLETIILTFILTLLVALILFIISNLNVINNLKNEKKELQTFLHFAILDKKEILCPSNIKVFEKRHLEDVNEDSSGSIPTKITPFSQIARSSRFFMQNDLVFKNRSLSFDIKNENLFKLVNQIPDSKRKRILVTGGAGFVGSHLVDSLMLDGHEVIVFDNFETGRKFNIQHWERHPNFEIKILDVINPLTFDIQKVDEIYHLASPASPVRYMFNPIKTIETIATGTLNMLNLAKRSNAKILIASTSEIYGDPEVHPQAETYWGHVNPIGPRSCYDESKRLSESLAVAFNSKENVSIAIARIFNTYGPRMLENDGRVISNFVTQALSNQPLTVNGDGQQTRSFQYITDLVDGLKKLMNNEESNLGPVNLGNPNEMTIHSLALTIQQLVPKSTSNITYNKLPIDDPHRRRPDISKAIKHLDWRPTVDLQEGLIRTIGYFEQVLPFYLTNL